MRTWLRWGPTGRRPTSPTPPGSSWCVAQDHAIGADGGRTGKHYYVNESVGIAVGFLLAAIRQAGLSALTHTPSPTAFLEEVLDRPDNERAYLVIPVSYAAEGCQVPDLDRKPLDAFVEWR